MGKIQAVDVKSLRAKTGLSILDCKRALEESEGDEGGAIRILKEKGLVKVGSRGGKMGEGGIVIEMSEDGKEGVIVEVACETDFVSRNERFIEGSRVLARKILEGNLEEGVIGVGELVGGELREMMLELGESLKVGRYGRLKSEVGGFLGSYIHQGRTIGVLLEVGYGNEETVLKEGFRSFVKDIAMQIAAMDPSVVRVEELSFREVEFQRGIYMEQVKASGKPEKIMGKIVQGKLDQYYRGVVLLEQEFVKSPKQKVKEYIQQTEKELSDGLEVRRYIRFKVGE